MNIEEANDNLIMLKYFLQEEGDENWEKYCESIEALLTAYEKEKAKVERIKDKLTHLKILAKIENKDIDRIKELEILLKEE